MPEQPVFIPDIAAERLEFYRRLQQQQQDVWAQNALRAYVQFQAPPGLVAQPLPQPIPEPSVKDDESEMKLLNPFLVGCDPEFVVLDTAGKLINMKATFVHDGPVGYDHDGDVLEVRPEPARSIGTLLKHIRDTIKTAKYPGRLRAGAVFNTGKRVIGLGGHVHLDVSFNNPMLMKQIEALNNFTKILVDRDILPKIQFETRQATTGYGKYGDVRRADYADRLEYRTMASWLFSPITSYLCLTGAKLATAQPGVVIDALASPKGKLTKMFGRFMSEDYDAARVSELILENGVKLQRDPDANLLDVWGRDSQELKTLEIE